MSDNEYISILEEKLAICLEVMLHDGHKNIERIP